MAGRRVPLEASQAERVSPASSLPGVLSACEGPAVAPALLMLFLGHQPARAVSEEEGRSLGMVRGYVSPTPCSEQCGTLRTPEAPSAVAVQLDPGRSRGSCTAQEPSFFLK